MDKAQEKEKLESLINKLNLKTSKPNAKPNKGDRYKIRGENSKDSLWIQVQQKKFFVSLSGDKKSNEHKKIYDYIGRDYDPGNIQNDHWDLDSFNEIENIVYCYAGVKKENMEQNQGGENMDAKLEKAISVLKNKKQIILQGSPGTGKTRLAKEIAYYLIKDEVLSNDEKERQEQLVFLIQPNKDIQEDISNAIVFEDYIQNKQTMHTIRGKEFTIIEIRENHIYVEIGVNRYSHNVLKTRILDRLHNQNWSVTQGLDTYEVGIGQYIHKMLQEKNEIDSDNVDLKQYRLIQFHPAYGYEDFVRGIVATTTTTDGNVSYEVQNKILAEMAENAINNPDEKFVLIVDEINRANLSSVLGELIYALEYRGESVESMYEYQRSRKIILPENLYIIGTMNTADRSVGHIDYAIRRRFAFVDVNTDESVILDDAKSLFNKVKDLFEQYLNKEEFELNDVMIGHSYFLKKNLELALALEYEIKPILQEYRKDGVLTCEKNVIDDLDVD